MSRRSTVIWSLVASLCIVVGWIGVERFRAARQNRQLRQEYLQLKQVRRPIGTAADDHLSPGSCDASAVGAVVLHADGTIVLDQDASGLAARADHEIPA